MSDFLERLIAQGKDILGESAKLPDREDTVRMDRYDLLDWTEMTEVPAIKRIMVDLSRKHDYVAQAMQDLFGALYKTFPEISDVGEMKPTHRGLHAMIVKIMQSPEFQNLRQHSTGDEYASAMGMMVIGPELDDLFTETEGRTREAREQLQLTEEQMEALRQRIQELIDNNEVLPPGPEGDPGRQMTQEELDALLADLENLQIQWTSQAQGITDITIDVCGGFGGVIRQAIGQAAGDLDDEEALFRSYGVEDGVVQKMDFEERRALADRLRNSRLAEFTKLIGQFKNVQSAEVRKRVKDASSDIHGVRLSDELHRLTMSEYTNFATPEQELLFYKRWSEDRLLTHAVSGKEKLGQGPIVMVVDESGSMGATDVQGGTREAWSKALALAMLDQARHRNRDFVYIGFSSSRQQHTVRFRKGEYGLDDVLEMTEHFYGGGTSYEEPLRLAMEVVQEYASKDKPKPDIVFVSDDEYGAMDEDFMRDWLKVKEDTSLICYGIAIGCGYSGAMEQLSDNVRSIAELTSDPRSAGDLFRTI